jgi:hypothetical protein
MPYQKVEKQGVFHYRAEWFFLKKPFCKDVAASGE